MDTNREGWSDPSLQQAGYDLIAASFEVYNTLGAGLLPEIYQESLELELSERGIQFVSKAWLPIRYKTVELRKGYEADLLVDGEIVVEIKSTPTWAPEQEGQLFNHLRVTGKNVGYLINFGTSPKLVWKRIVL